MMAWSPGYYEDPYVWRVRSLICSFLDLAQAVSLIFCAIIWVSANRLFKSAGFLNRTCILCDLHRKFLFRRQKRGSQRSESLHSGELPKNRSSEGDSTPTTIIISDCACRFKVAEERTLRPGGKSIQDSRRTSPSFVEPVRLFEDDAAVFISEVSAEEIKEHTDGLSSRDAGHLHLRRFSQESFSCCGSPTSPADGTDVEYQNGSPVHGDDAEEGALAALYLELEAERNAACSAANETMAMISRLQEEKAAIEMEARQYQRIVEETHMYDRESIALLQEIICRRDEEVLALEEEVDLYRNRLLTLGMDALMYQDVGRDWWHPGSQRVPPGRIEELATQGNYQKIYGIVNQCQTTRRVRCGEEPTIASGRIEELGIQGNVHRICGVVNQHKSLPRIRSEEELTIASERIEELGIQDIIQKISTDVSQHQSSRGTRGEEELTIAPGRIDELGIQENVHKIISNVSQHLIPPEIRSEEEKRQRLENAQKSSEIDEYQDATSIRVGEAEAEPRAQHPIMTAEASHSQSRDSSSGSEGGKIADAGRSDAHRSIGGVKKMSMALESSHSGDSSNSREGGKIADADSADASRSTGGERKVRVRDVVWKLEEQLQQLGTRKSPRRGKFGSTTNFSGTVN